MKNVYLSEHVMPTNINHIDAIIGDIFRNAALQQARQFTGVEALELEEMSDNFVLGQVISRQMTLIVISGPDLSAQFKIHFNNSEGDKLRQSKFGAAPSETEARVKTLDYFKELTNQICGRICRIFQVNNIPLGISIPLSLRGFYEIYTSYTPSNGALTKFGLAWRIRGDFGSFVCTTHVEINNPEAFSNLQHVDDPSSSNDNEEMVFL